MFLDSSVIIDYLDGDEKVVEFVARQSVLRTASICTYEVLAGEVFTEGESDIQGARNSFRGVTAVPFTEDCAVEAATMQNELLETGDPMSPRDLFVAATARVHGAPLAVSDSDFETDVLSALLSIERL